jgi:hypothetical protein
MTDLDDQSRCPTADTCASCASADGLAVSTGQTTVGVFCITLCGGCTDAGRLPILHAPTAVIMSLRHCEHLGITADQMRALILGEAP